MCVSFFIFFCQLEVFVYVFALVIVDCLYSFLASELGLSVTDMVKDFESQSLQDLGDHYCDCCGLKCLVLLQLF